jgi:hypothetical protein
MLTVESLLAELGLTLATGEEHAKSNVRWVHSTELLDPTPWLRGGELLLTTGLQLSGAKVQREFVQRLAEREIAGLGFGTGFVHKKMPAAVLGAARKLGFPLFEVPYELPFIAVTERVFAQLLNERYELLQRNMAGDILAEALTGRLYPEELQSRLRPFGIGEQAAVLAFALHEPATAASTLEAMLERAGVHSLVALRNGLLCAVVNHEEGFPTRARGATPAEQSSTPADPSEDPVELARRVRAELGSRFGEVRAAASRVGPTQQLRRSAWPTAAPRTSPHTRTSARSSCCSPCRTTMRSTPTVRACSGRSKATRASTATSCCAPWTSSSNITATGSAPRKRSTATATPCATGSSASSS